MCKRPSRRAAKVGALGQGLRSFNHAVGRNRNGVDVVLQEGFERNLVGVKRASDRMT